MFDSHLIEIEAAGDVGIPARILDLFMAINWLPNSFGYRRAGAGVLLDLDVGGLPDRGRNVILAKLARIDGVRRVTTLALP